MNLFDKDRFNKNIGTLILKSREREGFSRQQIVELIPSLTINELREIEKGKRSISCHVLYQLYVYLNFTHEEISYFCCRSIS